MSSELIHTILDIWLLLIAIASTWAGRYWRKRCKAAEARPIWEQLGEIGRSNPDAWDCLEKISMTEERQRKSERRWLDASQ